MLESIEQVCNNLPHFGTITQDGKDIEIWAKVISHHNYQQFNTAGIYCIENYITNKIYIGMSKDVAGRIKTHKRELNPRSAIVHHNKEMYNDSVQYGLHNFSFGVLETFDDVDTRFLMWREEEWIRYYENQSPNCLYNKNRLTNLLYECYTPESIQYKGYGQDGYAKEEVVPDKTYMKNKIELSPNREEIINLLTAGHSTRNIEDYLYHKYGEKISHVTLAKYRRDNISYEGIPSDNSKEEYPIDYIIADVLQMKVEAHNIQNDKLFYFADYLEKRLLQFKKGEIEFIREVPR